MRSVHLCCNIFHWHWLGIFVVASLCLVHPPVWRFSHQTQKKMFTRQQTIRRLEKRADNNCICIRFGRTPHSSYHMPLGIACTMQWIVGQNITKHNKTHYRFQCVTLSFVLSVLTQQVVKTFSLDYKMFVFLSFDRFIDSIVSCTHLFLFIAL